jgi:arginine:pyruvate transaminase
VLAADTFGPSAAGHVRITFAIADAKLAEACNRIAEFVACLTTPQRDN